MFIVSIVVVIGCCFIVATVCGVRPKVIIRQVETQFYAYSLISKKIFIGITSSDLKLFKSVDYGVFL